VRPERFRLLTPASKLTKRNRSSGPGRRSARAGLSPRVCST
jgi:hypothetical protein